MPLDSSAPARRATLQGAWDIIAVTERLKFPCGELDLLLEANPRQSRLEIDLARVTGIDACGCQLLAVFVARLKRHGIAALPCGIPPEIMDQVGLLGFDAFAASNRIEQVSA